jgi:DNA ligase (NAD+)
MTSHPCTDEHLRSISTFSGRRSSGTIVYYFDADMNETGYSLWPEMSPEIAVRTFGRTWSDEALDKLHIIKIMTTTTKLNNAEREQKLRVANEAYMNGNAIMRDSEYDALWREHQDARADDAHETDDPVWRDTILDKVGAAPHPQSGFAKVKHSCPMQSLDNVFAGDDGNIDELTKWLAKLNGDEACKGCALVAEPKIDGLSLRLTYARIGQSEHIHLTKAVTRGDGETGDDVTLNVMMAKLVPLELQCEPVEINGEVFMTFADFEALNERQKAAGEEVYSNPRNAAAGILRRKNPAEVAGQGLSFIAHGIASDTLSDCYGDDAEWLQSLGLKFAPAVYLLADGSHRATGEVISWLRLKEIADQPYPTDGVVLKVNDYKLREHLGSTSRAPRWAIAFKFKQDEVETTLKAITVQVGRSGVLTPVAELEPVEVDGSVVSRATLHNEDQVNRLGLAVGDRVIVRKAGAVIPEIVRVAASKNTVDTARRMFGDDPTREQMRVARVANFAAAYGGDDLGRPQFNLPDHIGGKCPSCGSTSIEQAVVMRAAQSVGKSTAKAASVWMCTNTAGCKAQMAARIEHMASRDCLNLSQMGTELCAEIAFRAPLEIDNFQHPFDLFKVPASWFANLSWTTESGGKMTFGESRAETLHKAMRAAEKLPLRNWIAALGIHTIGKNTSKEISRLCRDVLHLVEECTSSVGFFRRMVGYPAVSSTPEFDIIKKQYEISHHLGPVSLMALVNFVNGTEGRRVLSLIPDTVKSDNYAPEPVKAEPAAGDSLFKGKTVVLTGTISVPRHVMEAELEKAGAKLSGSVSKKTDFLIAGEDCGSKLKKAQDAGVRILTEAEARAML